MVENQRLGKDCALPQRTYLSNRTASVGWLVGQIPPPHIVGGFDPPSELPHPTNERREFITKPLLNLSSLSVIILHIAGVKTQQEHRRVMADNTTCDDDAILNVMSAAEGRNLPHGLRGCSLLAWLQVNKHVADEGSF